MVQQCTEAQAGMVQDGCKSCQLHRVTSGGLPMLIIWFDWCALVSAYDGLASTGSKMVLS